MAEIAEVPLPNQLPSDAEDAGEPEPAAGEPEPAAGELIPSFPTGRVKRIMRLDGDINKVTSEALLMVSLSTELFIGLLAERAGNAAIGKRRKTLKLEDLRAAITNHLPTADFLLDCLPEMSKLPPPQAGKKSNAVKLAPAGVRRIDEMFSKSAEITQ